MIPPKNTNSPMISQGVPLTDKNNNISLPWYQFLFTLYNRTGGTQNTGGSNVMQEKIERQNADAALNTAIGAEGVTRANADTAEAATRSGADTAESNARGAGDALLTTQAIIQLALQRAGAS